MNTLIGLARRHALVMLAAHPALAQDKTLAIVVKGLDNPFFEQINLGCQKWNAENKGKGYTCLYTGPASSADEAGEVQIVDDLLTKGVAAIAISPSNAPLMANLLKKKAPKIPVMTIDADLSKEDAGLRKTYLGTDNYLMGVKFAEYLKKLKPKGGTVCLQLGNVAADNINARAAGTRDTLAGAKGTKRLTGQNGWKEIDGCPVFTNDQADLANRQMADVFTANPKLDAFVLEGGWAQFAPQAYAQVTGQVMEKLKSKALIIVAGDTLPPQIEALKAGRSHVQVGQRPFEMGYRAPTRDDRSDQRQEGRAGDLHRPRRVHAGQRRQVHRQVARSRVAYALEAAPAGDGRRRLRYCAKARLSRAASRTPPRFSCSATAAPMGLEVRGVHLDHPLARSGSIGRPAGGVVARVAVLDAVEDRCLPGHRQRFRGPVLSVPGLRGRTIGIRDRLPQMSRDGAGVAAHGLLDDAPVPHAVKVSGTRAVALYDPGAPAIVREGDVQRLV